MSNQDRICAAAAIVIIFIASSASACLNDTSVRAAEDEFRSRYESTSTTGNPEFNPPQSINPWGVVGLSVGSGLIAGSCIAGIRRGKKPSA